MRDWRGIGSDYRPYTEPRPVKCPSCGFDSMTTRETHVSDGYSVSWRCIPCDEKQKQIAAEENEAFKRANGIYDGHVIALSRLYTGRCAPETNIWDIVFRPYKAERLRDKRRAEFKSEYDLMVTAYFARLGTQPSDEQREAVFKKTVLRVMECEYHKTGRKP